ncbi:MAG: nuclear transport factor 2 family protein [Bacteroidota bacterium]
MKNLFIVLTSSLITTTSLVAQTPEQLAQTQLNAYNNRDLEAFLEPYSDTVKVYNFPNDFRYQGKETMRKNYGGMFERLTDLNCELVNRMVSGNTVIDHERVLFEKGRPKTEVFALYKIAHGKIQEVYFIRPGVQ